MIIIMLRNTYLLPFHKVIRLIFALLIRNAYVLFILVRKLYLENYLPPTACASYVLTEVTEHLQSLSLAIDLLRKLNNKVRARVT